MASMKEIKRRRASIQSTGQITKAMKLVSTVKLQKTRMKAEESGTYFRLMHETIGSILERSSGLDHQYLKSREDGKKAVIAITANRGLAGGYNSNIVKLVSNACAGEQVQIYAIGKKGRDGLERRGFSIAGDFSEIVGDPVYEDAADITKLLLEKFEQGEISEIYLAYTEFKNTVVHHPTLIKLLPIVPQDLKSQTDGEKEKPKLRNRMNYSPNEEEVLSAIVPKYIASIIFGALQQSVASENGARMTAMENATNNAEELIEKLGLAYNRARQGAITQELTEIVAGANAIN